jgi:hypothetical protein
MLDLLKRNFDPPPGIFDSAEGSKIRREGTLISSGGTTIRRRGTSIPHMRS